MKAKTGDVYTVYNKYLERYTACQVAYIAPVSYTHLDVYKRQGLDKIGYPNEL